MAILKIARMGHPVLQARAAPVDDPTAPDIRRLIADMVETMHDADGAGLAAPQVHVSRRVVVFESPRARDPDNAQALTVLINPVIEPLTDETDLGWEGCLSVPGMMGLVPRVTRIRYRAHDHQGNLVEREAEGFHARVVQHECDHLDGILYPMRMTDMSKFGFVEEIQRGIAAEEKAAAQTGQPEMELAE